jgi:anti-anti-sigma factor
MESASDNKLESARVSHEDLSDQLRRVKLAGRLDMLGMGDIDLRFTSLAAARPIGVIVDLSEVSFLASIGIRSIISCARALDSKGGRMVLMLGDNALVRSTLETSGITDLIPTFADDSEAQAALLP